MNTFKSLPLTVQEEIKSVLTAYDKCYVNLKKDGSYTVETFTALHCGEYDQYVGTFTKDEVFTEEEQILNYVRSFRDFPFPEYKGKKDWKALNSEWSDVNIVDGNIIFIK